jgi:hypothetical protein
VELSPQLSLRRAKTSSAEPTAAKLLDRAGLLKRFDLLGKTQMAETLIDV